MKIVITGATGLIGQELVHRFASEKHQVIALVRNPEKMKHLQVQCIQWNAASGKLDPDVLLNADAVINLAGTPIAGGRWTSKFKNSIAKSRVDGTKNLVDAINQLPQPHRPKLFLSASAVGYYGDRGDDALFETSLQGEGFLSQVCADWETEALKAKTAVHIFRLGVVLSKNGGALAKMAPVVLGSGMQWLSWVHINDVLRFIEFDLTQSKSREIYNLTSPQPLTNLDFTKVLAKKKRFPLLINIPSFILKLTLGEMAAVILQSQRVFPKRAQSLGFKFEFSDLSKALDDLIN